MTTYPAELTRALRAGDLTATEQILARLGTDIIGIHRCRDGQTALEIAAAGGHVPLLAYLLDRGAEIEARDHRGRSALHLAASAGHPGAVRALIRCGARLESVDQGLRTALHCVAIHGHPRCLGILLDAGAEVDARDARGITPLYLAALTAQRECLRMLLVRGANPTLGCWEGASAERVAEQHNDRRITEMFRAASSRRCLAPGPGAAYGSALPRVACETVAL